MQECAWCLVALIQQRARTRTLLDAHPLRVSGLGKRVRLNAPLTVSTDFPSGRVASWTGSSLALCLIPLSCYKKASQGITWGATEAFQKKQSKYHKLRRHTSTTPRIVLILELLQACDLTATHSLPHPARAKTVENGGKRGEMKAGEDRGKQGKTGWVGG